jgi:site-specific recombinase XerD
MVMRLLTALGADPAVYEAGSIRQVILDEVKDTSAAYAKTMTTALRCYLRFLGASGECRTDLTHAVPTIPQWRLSATPRYLPSDDVERLIASCDTSLAHGVRDKAILLLLSRLGLRAGDVLALRLDHICWADGTLRIGGKGRRDVCLPLPQDAGDALLDYICGARPTSDSDIVFLRSCAPHRPFAVSSSISSVVKQALARAGISNPPSHGANLLRHSAATSMLRAGATLDTIGTVLRHRSATTTAHYAKVDIPMLLQVAQPWPEHGHAE